MHSPRLSWCRRSPRRAHAATSATYSTPLGFGTQTLSANIGDRITIVNATDLPAAFAASWGEAKTVPARGQADFTMQRFDIGAITAAGAGAQPVLLIQ